MLIAVSGGLRAVCVLCDCRVSSHRYHHLHCDTPLDPHSPYEGFWWSHMGWLLDNGVSGECWHGPPMVAVCTKGIRQRVWCPMLSLEPQAVRVLP